MKIIGDYHTHTTYSHGSGSIRDNVEVAIKRGLKEVAICDHGPSHIYGVRKKKLFQMRREIDELNEEYKDKIRVLLGVEANVVSFNGDIDIDDEILEIIDILLLGFHYGIIPKSIRDGFLLFVANPISKKVARLNNIIKEKNTQALIRAINRYPVDIITHPGSKARLNIEKLARAAHEKGVALEINSSHSQLSLENIKKALKTNVEFVINSDAHDPEDVGNVEEGIIRALEGKIPIHRIRNLEA